MDRSSAFSIDKEHLRATCKIGQGAGCCRWITCGATGFECAKHQPIFAKLIEDRIAAGTMGAKGDNCDGKRRVLQ